MGSFWGNWISLGEIHPKVAPNFKSPSSFERFNPCTMIRSKDCGEGPKHDPSLFQGLEQIAPKFEVCEPWKSKPSVYEDTSPVLWWKQASYIILWEVRITLWCDWYLRVVVNFVKLIWVLCMRPRFVAWFVIKISVASLWELCMWALSSIKVIVSVALW